MDHTQKCKHSAKDSANLLSMAHTHYPLSYHMTPCDTIFTYLPLSILFHCLRPLYQPTIVYIYLH